ncbi:MAG: ArgE/DapE family deacylase [Solirubrobacteraceae bacterium]
MTPTTQELAAAVEAQRPWMEDLLVRLVEAPTTLGREEPGQAIMADAFADAGLAPRDVPLDGEALRRHPNASPFSWDVAGKRCVVADWPGAGTGGRSLILGGHVDVVPPAAEELWTHPPFQAVRDGDWLYGRGGGDMKAGLVAMTGAARAVAGLGLRPQARVQLQSVVEEECTGNGALQCVLSEPPADACVITEPHPDHFTIAQVGVLWFHVDILGVPAHAARASTLGTNAIDAATRITAALRELERELNADPPAPYDRFEHPINLNPGIIAGGDWTSTVAAHCTVSYRLACYPDDDPAELRRQVENCVAAAARDDAFLAGTPPRVRFEGFSCEGFVVSESEPVIASLAGAYEAVLGVPPELVPTTATTDARHYVRSGIPTICFGPRAEEIHGIDERVSLSSLGQTATVLALFLRDWCGLA